MCVFNSGVKLDALQNFSFKESMYLETPDSLVGFYFEVSAFLKLMSIFVPAEGRARIPRRLALQVQLVSFHQRLASHLPQLRRRGWT